MSEAALAPARQFTAAEQEVARYQPRDVQAPNHNDLRSFIHSWFAAFDHRTSADYFLRHLDDADMTFNFDGQALAHDHQSFRTWYADALEHIPWDFHNIIDVTITGTCDTGWTADFFFIHVGEWRDAAQDAGRSFNRVLHGIWRVEHTGDHFVIRRYELAIAQNTIPL